MNCTDTKEVPYSYANQPPTIQEAMRRLDEDEESIARITADLQSRTERDLGTPDSYDDWKFRATRALNHKQREKRFLIQWINRKTKEAAEMQAAISNQERLEKLAAMINDFLASATPYKPVFSKENPPQNLRQVTERRAELSDLKIEYGEFTTHLKEEMLRLGFPPNFQGGGRGKVAGIIQKAERELLLLKKFNRIFASSESEEGRGLPDPLPSGNSNISAINKGLHEIKAQLGMDGAAMTVWLFKLLEEQKTKLRLTKEQEEKLALIEKYVQLTLQRREIEFQD